VYLGRKQTWYQNSEVYAVILTVQSKKMLKVTGNEPTIHFVRNGLEWPATNTKDKITAQIIKMGR